MGMFDEFEPFDTQDYPMAEVVKTEKEKPRDELVEKLSDVEKEMLQKALLRYKPKKPSKVNEGSVRFNIWLSEDRRADLELLTPLLDKRTQSQLFVDYLDDLRFKYADLLKAMREKTEEK